MKVSVIIPVYNVEPYVQKCLQSVFAQTYKDVEVILIDDCSTDQSMSIVNNVVSEYNGKFSIRIIRNEHNLGLSQSRNRGIDDAKGEYVFFLDSDDEISKDCIQTLVSAAIDNKPDVVIGDYAVHGSSDYFPPLKLNSGRIRNREAIIKAYAKEKIYVMAWNKLVKRSFIIRNHLYFVPGIIHEDCLWSFQIACLSQDWVIAKKTTYYYKVRSGSIKTDTDMARDIHCLKYVLSNMVRFAVEHNLCNNKYIYSFLEEEKLRLLSTYLHYGVKKQEIMSDLYPFIKSLRYVDLRKPILWSKLKARYMVRDIHYYMLPQEQAYCFVHLHDLLALRSGWLSRCRLLCWVFNVWFLYVIGNPQKSSKSQKYIYKVLPHIN